MRILGIDPGSVLCGYGVIDTAGRSASLVEYGTIEVKKRADSFPIRMREIYSRICSVIDRTQPQLAAIEKTFYSKNAQSLIKLTMARSAALLAVVNNDIVISEYSPAEIKKAVTGNGKAGKEQVQYMVKGILSIEEDIDHFDSTDALAIAICHSFNYLQPKRGKGGWKEFLADNPDRIAKL